MTIAKSEYNLERKRFGKARPVSMGSDRGRLAEAAHFIDRTIKSIKDNREAGTSGN